MVFSYYYFNNIQTKKTAMQMLTYEKQAKSMQSRVAQMIYAKQKATTAIGLVLVQDKNLIDGLKKRKIDDEYYKNLILNLKNDTSYKNIWIHIVDRKLNTVYRSWTNKAKNLKEDNDYLKDVIESKKVSYTICSGKFTIAIKALIPIVENQKVLGVLEVISHFNSIAVTLKNFNIDSVVVLNKKSSQKLRYPFTETFLDGYYIANFNAPKEKLEYLQKQGVENYFTTDYKIEKNQLISAFPLISYDGEILGYYIMFKRLNSISSADEDFFQFKWIAIGFIIILTLVMVVNLILIYTLSRQKSYIKNIIDSSTNIVIINNKHSILDVNKAFFEYFTNEKSLEAFKTKYSCVCDLFVDEEGYVSKFMEGELWIDYVLEHKDVTHKVKINYDDKLYYFTLGITLISQEEGYYSVVLSDVTKEEMYKLDLEKLTITDTLTGVGNRRYFTTKIEENISLAKRYKFPLSLIMLDIDHFKQVNDKHGHGVGDNVLIEYTKLISSMIREADIFCRIGGEEFVIIVPYADAQKATKFAEKIRKKVAEYKVVLPITMSFGVTEYIQGEDSDHILTRVDEALYEAKENGRNQVVSK